MLTKLSVSNFAIISHVEFELKPGLNVFTGETGAGKSVAILALSFVLGSRGSAGLIKDGASKLEVRAEFQANLSSKLLQKYALSGKQFVLIRSLDRNGKSRSSINGKTVPTAALAEIGRELVDFHGQHEHQSLLRSEIQLELLDMYAKVFPLREKVYVAWKRWSDAQARLAAAQLSEQEKQRQLDLYTFQLQEIEKVNPQLGEDVELEQKLPQFKHAGKLLELANGAYQDLYESENAAVTLLGRAARQVREIAQIDDQASALADALTQAETLASDAASDLSVYQEGLHADPHMLDEMLSRHEKLKRLKLKYGPELTDVLKTAEEMKAQIDRLQNSELLKEELEKEIEKSRAELDVLCEQLHVKRCVAAQKLATTLQKEISPLGFNGLEFEIAVEMDSENPTPVGADQVEFLFSPNPGQTPRPLRAIASGGELSRVMLGLKTVLAGNIPLMIFDEVDSGVGGKTAVLVGRKLRAVAQGRQVLCVTHLPSVAACANAHFFIEKKTDGKQTDVSVYQLENENIVKEIARMLGAVSESDDTALAHARKILADSQK